MALSKFMLPGHLVSRRVLLPAFSSLQRLPAEDLFSKLIASDDDLFQRLLNRRPMFGFDSDIPIYRVNEDGKKYEIAIDLPGVKAHDMKIKLQSDNILHLIGGRKFQEEGHSEETKFGYRFNLANKNLDLDNLQANLSDGVLKISVPALDQVAGADKSKEINIIEGDVDPNLRLTDDIED